MSSTAEPMSMLPPQSLPDSQESNTTTSSTGNSTRSFRSNAYAPASMTDPTPPSSAEGHVYSKQYCQGETLASQLNTLQPQAPLGKSSSTASSSSSRTSGSPTHGSKRTANGAIKPQSARAYAKSPDITRKGGHSRNISMDTTTSSIGELSAQLKFRLSHAMTKVQHGQYSPSLTSPTVANRATSPRTSLANTATHSRTLSQVLSSQPGTHQQSVPGAFYASPHHHRAKQSESYERGQPMPPSSQQHTKGQLAPAPNLTTAPSARRTNGQPPQLQTSHSDSAKGREGFTTPTQTQTPTQRLGTPTQQEQEAVDTLVLMASPRHAPQHRDRNRDLDGPGSAAPSPLRGEFARGQSSGMVNGVEGDEVFRRPDRVVSPGYGDSSRDAKRRSMGLGEGRIRSPRDVEGLLDRMAAEEEDDDGEGDGDVRREGLGVRSLPRGVRVDGGGG